MSASSISALSSGGVSDDATGSAPRQAVNVIAATSNASIPWRSSADRRDHPCIAVDRPSFDVSPFSLLRIGFLPLGSPPLRGRAPDQGCSM
jgi:hypothetical protein